MYTKILLLFLAFIVGSSPFILPESTQKTAEKKATKSLKNATSNSQTDTITSKEESIHEKIMAYLASGRVTKKMLQYDLENNLTNKQLVVGLQGGNFDWNVCKKLGIRYVTTFIWFFILGTNSLLSRIFSSNASSKNLLPFGFKLSKLLNPWISTFFEVGDIPLFLNSGFVFNGIIGYMLWSLYEECRTPSYLMIVLNSKNYHNKDKQEDICRLLLRYMCEHKVDLKQKSVLLNNKAELQVQKIGIHLKRLEEEREKVFEEDYFTYLWQYYITSLFKFGLNHSALVVKRVTALHLAYEAGFETIQQGIIRADPDAENIGGYSFEDDMAGMIRSRDDKIPEWQLKLTIVKTLIFGKIPTALFFEEKKPADFAYKK